MSASFFYGLIDDVGSRPLHAQCGEGVGIHARISVGIVADAVVFVPPHNQDLGTIVNRF
jgi:hypothetical protein